ncbi:malate dehydrogenase [Ectothiorhodospiraceae bacterium WFHF3C12]|nr:malate dehydrogenase [Ectothiorhodospiraceae bacterium WFHF3C12]
MSVITADDVEGAGPELRLGKEDIVTPLAWDRAGELGVEIRYEASDKSKSAAPSRSNDIPTGQNPAPRSGAHGNARNASSPPTQLGAFSGALYRRGAPLPGPMEPRPGTENTRADSGTVADSRPRVAVIGAGHVGATTALRLVETSLFSTVTMIDIVPGLAEGLALDMWHSAGLRGFTSRVHGSDDLNSLRDADYIVMTAGRPRKPGMTRTDLTEVNAKIIHSVAEKIREYAPNAVVVVVTNPLEEMTELMTRRTGFEPERVIGMAGVLDSARFCSLVALTGIAEPGEVEALALGSHGPEMVIPLSLATARGRPLADQLPADELEAIVERARNSGAEVVGLLKEGSAYYSPGESAASMVRAMVTGDNSVIAACVRPKGVYGLADTRVGLPVRLGRHGLAEVVELPLRADEMTALQEAANRIAERVDALG